MKKIIAIAAALIATSAYANIDNSPHDLATVGSGLCQFCHVPHNANSAGNGLAPIWARTIGSAGQYTAYGTTAGGGVPNLQTTKMSLLCMSCHDGATSVNTLYTGQTLPATRTGALTGDFNLGTTLQNDHPVGVAYVAGGAAGLAPIATATGRGFRLFTGNFIECGSCHEPHTWSGVATNANYKFKRTITAGLDFCGACHDAK